MDYLLLVALFVIAFLYSSVGHGGASGYLALMALFSISPAFMKSAALSLNVFVAGIAFANYARAGYFRFRLILPFLITSVPMAYLGAMLKIRPDTYELILGIFLFLAVIRMLFVTGAIVEQPSMPPLWGSLLTGAVLGMFSGMIGIGGGIILSPILILMHWATVKESAAASALFIVLNSLSGLLGLFHTGFSLEPKLILWISTGLLGGLAGSYIGSYRLASAKLKYLLASILLVACFKLVFF